MYNCKRVLEKTSTLIYNLLRKVIGRDIRYALSFILAKNKHPKLYEG